MTADSSAWDFKSEGVAAHFQKRGRPSGSFFARCSRFFGLSSQAAAFNKVTGDIIPPV
jgi:hypothetical protein